METAASRIRVELERWPLVEPFTISRRTFHDSLIATALVENARGDRGRGECEPHEWDMDASATGVREAGLDRDGARPAWLAGLSRANLANRLLRSPLRNAIDCALWDLDAKASGLPAHALAGTPWQPLPVMPTLGIDLPQTMATRAQAHRGAPWLKVKVGSSDGRDAERIEAVAGAVPGTALLLDANAGWTPPVLQSLLPLCRRLGVRVIEQPLDPAHDASMPRPVGDLVFCADESCLDRSSLAAVRGRFQVINIKLDKTGGLTEALALRRAAEAGGLGVMVGMMSGSSLAVAPAFLLAQGLDLVDLELGFLRQDRVPPMTIADGLLMPPPRGLWG